jgi:hypothetical protein
MTRPFTIEERQIVAKGKSYQESLLFTDNTRLAAIFLVFGANLYQSCPLEWVDLHKSKESFLRYLEDPSDPRFKPISKVTFNFESGTIPEAQIVKAFGTDYEKLQEIFEDGLEGLSDAQKETIRNAVSQLIVRACHEVLLRREELVRLLKRVPDHSKFDRVKNVVMGKNSSPELRKEFLSKVR